MKLSLGTVQFGLNYGIANTKGQVSFREAQAIISLASDLGINTFDTASAYGDSEEVLGKLCRTDHKVVTKLSAVPNNCEDVHNWVFNQVDASIARLKTESIDALLLHRPEQLLSQDGETLYRAVSEVKSQGKVKKIGVSVYCPKELEQLWGKFSFDVVQAPFNILDRRIIESGWAKRLHAGGVELHTRSTFLQGLLLMSSHQRPRKFDKWSYIFEAWDRWLVVTNLKPQEACLRFAVNQDLVDRVIVGVDSADQLSEISNALGGPLNSLPQFDLINDDLLLNPSNWSDL